IFILPFDARVRGIHQGRGTEADQARLLAAVENEQANGGTDFYTCALQAMELMAKLPDRANYLAAIALMTDGKSDTKNRDLFLRRWQERGAELPVFGIMFGDADRSQLDQLAEKTRARVFDATKHLREPLPTMRRLYLAVPCPRAGAAGLPTSSPAPLPVCSRRSQRSGSGCRSGYRFRWPW